MSDKFRKTIPIKITFGGGEQPSSIKLNAMSDQSRLGNTIIEKALGDLWNESGDTLLNATPLKIPNLARLIGQNHLFNPALVPTVSEFSYKENIGAVFLGKDTGYLKFPPKFGSIDETAAGDHFVFTNPAQFTTPVDFEYQVNSTGRYWIEKNTGKFRIFTPIVAAEKITYITDPSNTWLPGQETLPGVVPDPRQAQFTSCRISQNAGKFFLHFPPRQPLTLSTKEKPDNYPASSEIADNQQTTGGVAIKKYWQGSATALTGTGDTHYRYQLPKEIQDATLTAGQILPSGYLYLWDGATNTIISDVVFKWPDPALQGYALEVESTAFDFSLASIVSTTEAAADYNKTKLSIITVGSSVAQTAWTTMSSFLQHRHDNESTMEPSIQHKDLRDLNPPTAAALLTGEDYAGHNTRYPSYLKSWKPSNWFADEHTSLFSRAGSQVAGKERDKFNNAILGDLIIANADLSGNENYLANTIPDNAFKIYFGNNTGAFIGATNANGIIVSAAAGLGKTALTSTGDGGGAGVVGLGGTGSGPGLQGTGGAPNGDGVQGSGTGSGSGVFGTGGATNGIGILGQGTSSGSGVFGVGGTTNGIGVVGTGGPNGVGVFGQGGATNANGVSGQGAGSGQGVFGVGGTNNGNGVIGNGGGTSGSGVHGFGIGTGSGVTGTGGTNNGKGITGQGFGTGEGMLGVGGGTSGIGIFGTGGTPNGNGVRGQGTGSGTGVNGTGGSSGGIGVKGEGLGSAAGVFGKSLGGSGQGVLGQANISGPGVEGLGGSSSGPGVKGTGQGSESGVEGLGGSSGGIGVKGIGGNGGYGVEAKSDITSPIKSALYIVPQDTDPTLAITGNVYVNNNTGLPRIYNGSQWTQMGGVVHRILVSQSLVNTSGNYTASQFVIPANTLQVGSVIKIRFSARVMSYTTGTWNMDFLINNGTQLQTDSEVPIVGSVCVIEGTGTCRAIGVSGDFLWDGIASVGQEFGGGTDQFRVSSFPDLADTTAAITLTPRLNRSGNITVDLRSFIVEIY